MPRKKLIQWISLAFLAIGLFLLIPGTDWHDSNSTSAFLSVLFGTAGSAISIFIPSNYVYKYNESSWIPGTEGRYKLIIKASEHGQGTSPSIQRYQYEDGNYSLVMSSPDCDEQGNIVFDLPEQIVMVGKVVIS
jgi:hypothetical protein